MRLPRHLKIQFESLRADVKTDLAKMDVKFANMEVKFAQMSENVQKAINRNMQWSIGLIAFIVTAWK